MLTITFSGPRGCGKTATLIMVAKLLKSLGQNVEFVGEDKRQGRFLKQAVNEPSPQLHEPRTVRLVDTPSVSDA